MADSKDDRKPADGARPVRPAVPPFRGPASAGSSPLKPMDPNSRLTRPPFMPPVIPGRKPVSPAAPPPVVHPMSSSTSTWPGESPVVTPEIAEPAPAKLPEAADVATEAEAPAIIVEAEATAVAEEVEEPQSGQEPFAFLDPAPFVGTRELAPPTPPPVRRPSGEVVAPMPDMLPSTSSSTSAHPIARSLQEIAGRVERGEIEVDGYEEGMSAEASLAAVLAAILKRAR